MVFILFKIFREKGLETQIEFLLPFKAEIGVVEPHRNGKCIFK
jgi:hypothetical protein